MIERKDIGSWISGVDSSNNDTYPGQVWNFPQTGPGSVAQLSRRFGALMIDWLLSVLVGNAFLGADPLLTPLFFFVMRSALVGTLGFTIGHWVFRIRVRVIEGKHTLFVASLIRTALTMLAIPLFIRDQDERGLHDKVAGTVVVRA